MMAHRKTITVTALHVRLKKAIAAWLSSVIA
jgi:hypothetical protein